MTNGEKFKEVFGISQVDEGELYVFAWLPNYDVLAEIPIDWWYAEYKAKGFLSKFNKILKTITPQEPTKNDLEVLRDTLVGRDILVGFKQGVDSIRALPSVTSQEPVLDKLRAEVECINVWAMRYEPDEYLDQRPQIVQKVKEHFIEIIDKYKAEKEQEDADT